MIHVKTTMLLSDHVRIITISFRKKLALCCYSTIQKLSQNYSKQSTDSFFKNIFQIELFCLYGIWLEFYINMFEHICCFSYVYVFDCCMYMCILLIIIYIRHCKLYFFFSFLLKKNLLVANILAVELP